MEQPSDALRERLGRLGISPPRVQAAMRRHLRAIARDLPVFDSAVVDACLRDGRLTRWQADALCGPNPDAIFLGPVTLEGVRQSDGFGVVYSARRDARTCELLRPDLLIDSDAVADERVGRLQDLAALGARLRDPGPVWITGAERLDDGGLAILSPAVAGPTLRELLIRRGRLAPAETLAIADGLLASLSVVHAADIAHGEVRVNRVRLTRSTRRDPGVRLMLPGVRDCLDPAVAYRGGLPLAACDAVAPERIGTAAASTVASDLFGVGCVLWELLAGRSPFPQAGSLGRLRAQLLGHRPPLGDFAADVPPALARLVEQCLSANPSDRPASAAAARERLAGVRRAPVSVSVRPARKSRGRSLAGGLLGTAAMLAAAGVWFGGRPQLPDTWQAWTAPTTPSGVAAAERTASLDRPALRPLPKPDADGTLRLSPGRYAADEIAWAGPLAIVGATDGDLAEVVIEAAASWSVIAEHVTLDSVRIEASGGQPAMRVSSQTLTLRDVSVAAAGCPVAVRWAPLDADDVAGRAIELERTRLVAESAAIALAEPVRMLTATDCVFEAAAATVWEHAWPRREVGMQLTHCTLRRLRSLAAVSDVGSGRGQQLRLLVDHCAFDPSAEAAVAAIGDVGALAEIRRRVRVEAIGCVSSRRWVSVASADAPLRDDDTVSIPTGPLWFDGDRLDDAACTLPSDAMPGVRGTLRR